MHLHRYEKIWLLFGVSMLVVFLIVLGVGAFAQGAQPPGQQHSGHGAQRETVNPETVESTAPFNQLGLKKSARTNMTPTCLLSLLDTDRRKWKFRSGQLFIFTLRVRMLFMGLRFRERM